MFFVLVDSLNRALPFALIRRRTFCALAEFGHFCSNPMAVRSAQYDARFKQKAILMAKEPKNSAAAQPLDVNESTVCKWRRQLDVLFKYEPDRKGFRGPHRGHHWYLEKKVAMFVTDEGKALTPSGRIKRPRA